MRNKVLGWQVFLFKHAKHVFIFLLVCMVFVNHTSISANSILQGTGMTYYVSTTGDDNNSGTAELPWRTIQKAADSMRAGDTALIRGGVYEEFVTISSSGTSREGYITFQAYPGEKPIIDGSRLKIGSGKHALIQLRKASYVVIEGFELRNLSSSSSSEYPAGIRVQDGGSNIHILNNNVHRLANTSPDGNAHGIHIYGNASLPLTDIRVSGNQVHHLTLGSSESLTISGNVDGFSVDRNFVHDNNNIGIDIAGFYGACSLPCLDQARNGVVAENTVYNIDSSINPAYGGGVHSAGGIYADGASDVIIERNQVYKSDFGIEIASENQGKATQRITVRNNYVHHNDGAGILMGGSEQSNGGAEHNRIENNTLFMNDQLKQGYGEITVQENASYNEIVNNILYGQAKQPMVLKWNESGGDNRVDYNLYFREGGDKGEPWRWDGILYKSWEDFKRATGFDAHSVFADPLFDRKDGAGISLTSGSPAIDRGLNPKADYGSGDYDGKARMKDGIIDIGASEFGGEARPTPSLPQASPIPSATVQAQPSPTPMPELPSSSQAPAQEAGFIIDGNFKDWTSVGYLAEGDSNVRSIQAAIRNNELNVLVKGQLLGEKGQLYLNTDGSSKTGFQAPYWDGAGADYMLEDGILYAYSGSGGTDWGWTEVRSYKRLSRFAINSSAVEMSIDLMDLGASADNKIKIGYIWNDSHRDRLPLTSQMSAVAVNMEPIPATLEEIKVDGGIEDWAGYSNLGMGKTNPTSLKAVQVGELLNLMVAGRDLGKKTQIYMNTDADDNSGYSSSRMFAKGFELLLENGRLYRYTGSGSDWSWELLQNLRADSKYAVSAAAAEAAIPLEYLKIRAGDTIHFGVLINDDKAKQLPSSQSSPMTYTFP